MATNLSRNKGMSLKKNISVFHAEIAYTDIPTSAEVYQLAQLPKEIIVTKVTTITKAAFVAGTSAVLDVGIGSGQGLQADTDLEAVAGTAVISRPNSIHLTGGALTVTPTYVGEITAGSVILIVEYLEYTKATGELTSFVA